MYTDFLSYDQEMEVPHPHRFRSTFIIIGGLLLGILSAFLIGITITKVTPQTLSLAYRIDANRTVFFVRTTDRRSFVRAIGAYAPMMHTAPSQLASLPQGMSYAFALLSAAGSDRLPWVIEVQGDHQRHTTFVSTNDPGLFLDVRDIGRSLGRSPALQESDRNATNLAFIDPSRLPLAGKTAVLARSILATFESAVVTWDGPQGKLILRKKEKTLFASSRPVSDLLPLRSGLLPVLSIAAGDPRSMAEALARSLGQENPSLAEGLKGILSAVLESFTHRTDLASAVGDLLSGPTRLLVTDTKQDGSTYSTGSGQAGLTTSGLRFVLSGHAKKREVADRWVDDLRSATIPARIRTQEFSSENSRIDVIADPSAYEKRTMSGWTMVEVGSGSSRQFTVAGKDDQWALSNEPAMLMKAIDHVDYPAGTSVSGPLSLAGTADIPLLTQVAGEWLPFLAPDVSSLTSTLFGTDVNRVDWKATDGASAVSVRFMLFENPTR